jgi:hypothetical protein
MASVYHINKGINRPILFKGLKAQWIGWLAGLMVGLLLLFSILYICGVPSLLCVLIVFLLGAIGINRILYYNNHYGEHGLMKKQAAHKIHKTIFSNSRTHFIKCRPDK